MRTYFTGFDVANTVRMAHSQRKITFVLVEGDTDSLMFQRFVDSSTCEILVCQGRPNVLQATRELDLSREAGFAACVDADFDFLLHIVQASPNLILTDFHDLLILLLGSQALDRVLSERGSVSKINDFESQTNATVMTALLNGAKPIGALRLLNQMEGLSLYFVDLDFASLVDRDSLEISLDRVATVVCQRSSYGAAIASVQSKCLRLLEHPLEPLQLCSGHDCVSILAVGLRRALGSQRAADIRSEVLELELRLAFDREWFGHTQIARDMRNWESRNSGWRILAKDVITDALVDTEALAG